jgi:hypothetical protein
MQNDWPQLKLCCTLGERLIKSHQLISRRAESQYTSVFKRDPLFGIR